MSILSTANDYIANGNSLTLPAGLAEGDILTVLCVTGNGGETISLSSGFTNIESGTVLGMTWEVFQKVAGASEAAPVLSTTRTTRCVSIRSDGLVGTISASGYGSTFTEFTFPDATAANDNADVVRVAFTQLSGANVTTPPTGTELFDLIVQSVGAAAWTSTSPAGSVGTDTVTIDSAKRGAAFTLVLENQAAGLTIDSTDASMQRDVNWSVVLSNPATVPTTLNTTAVSGDDTLTPVSVTGSDPYTVEFAVGDLSKQVDATGYPWDITVDAETVTTGNIPLNIQAGYTLVDLVDPITTNGSILFGATGGTVVTADHAEYEVTSTLGSGVTFSVAATGVWTITEATDGDWTTPITISRRVVQVSGTIGTEAILTLSPPTSTSNVQGDLIKWIIVNVEGATTTAKVISFLNSEGHTAYSVTQNMYDYLLSSSSKLDHNERYKDVSQE